jgi:hypothetical protein
MLRAMRAEPRGRASIAASPEGIERRHVFSAALAQAEELSDAAEAAGYAARPLPLFYMLSQAGRAIAAAYAGDDWKYGAHGITPSRDEISHLADRTVEARASGAFPVVCRATNSPGLHGSVSLSALWASLPELSAFPRLAVAEPRCLELLERPGLRFDSTRSGAGSIHRIARGLAVPPDVFKAGLLFPDLPEVNEPSEHARELLNSAYPTAANFTLDDGWRVPGGGRTVSIQWLAGDDLSAQRPISEVADYYEGTYFLRPGVDASHPMPSLLMTWWAILFLLSTLARYEPAGWSVFLNNERSVISTELQGSLDLALDRLPWLLVQALTDVESAQRALSPAQP